MILGSEAVGLKCVYSCVCHILYAMCLCECVYERKESCRKREEEEEEREHQQAVNDMQT